MWILLLLLALFVLSFLVPMLVYTSTIPTCASRAEAVKGYQYKRCPVEKVAKKEEEKEVTPKKVEEKRLSLADWVCLNSDFLMTFLEPKAARGNGMNAVDEGVVLIPKKLLKNVDTTEVREWLMENSLVASVMEDDDGINVMIEDNSLI